MRIDQRAVPVLFTEAARFQPWLDLEAAQAGLGAIPEDACHEIFGKRRNRPSRASALKAKDRPF